LNTRDSQESYAGFELLPVRDVYEDLLRRTLSKISSDLARLIFIASTRDYNTGAYHHEGLASRFSPEKASEALEMGHTEIFKQLAAYSLEALVEEIEIYACASRESTATIVRTWQKLEPYRVAAPLRLNPTIVHVFVSNIRLALAILRHRQNPDVADPSAASRLQLPGQ
jgi:hypothetical protein